MVCLMVVMVCLMPAGAIRGFVEVLVLALAEASVGAGAEAAAEADSGLGGRFELANNLQKGWILCQEEMVQGLRAKVPAQAAVWAKARVKVEAEWVDLLQQGRAEIAYVQTAEQRPLTLPDSLVMQKAVLSVVRK